VKHITKEAGRSKILVGKLKGKDNVRASRNRTHTKRYKKGGDRRLKKERWVHVQVEPLVTYCGQAPGGEVNETVSFLSYSTCIR